MVIIMSGIQFLRKTYRNHRFVGSQVTALLFFLSLQGSALAQSQTMDDFSINPPLSELVDMEPMVMLALSGDHQLFVKAYNDYDDISGALVGGVDGPDGLPDVTYKPNFDYGGYFDSEKCYVSTRVSYAAPTIYRVPEPTVEPHFTETTTVPTNDTANGIINKQYCNDNEWSGNFLNWATMTRIDIMRWVLYGGKRSTDTATQTILERSYLPNDSHSFAKYYAGADIAKLVDTTSLTGLSVSSCLGEPDQEACLMQRGVTFCNTTLGHVAGKLSQEPENVALAPKMRVARGNYALWASGERYQCLLGRPNEAQEYQEYAGAFFGVNGNSPASTGIYAYSLFPSKPADYNSPAGTDWMADYTVRVEVCGTAVQGAQDCKTYGTSSKPIGLLQQYGERAEGEIKFGLMTGGYANNKTSGVLRRNVGLISTEINSADGTFISGLGESAISTLNSLRLIDYHFFGPGIASDEHYNRGTYNASCPWHSAGFTEGQCRNWGNPFGEILAESYRYFAGAATSTITGTAAAAELTATPPGATIGAWTDPVTGVSDEACINFNVVGFNASATSFDDGLAGVTPASLGIGNGTDSIDALTNEVGVGEGASGGAMFFVGDNGATPPMGDNLLATSVFGQCTPKAITNLADVRGVCPESPRLEGSYLSAGLAYYVHTNDVRPDLVDRELTIQTYGLTLAGASPSISVEVSPGRTVEIVPTCKNLRNENGDTPIGNCALVDFKPIYASNAAAPFISDTVAPTKYLVTWEDTEHGSDFDQDLNGMIEYELVGATLKITTRVFSQSTSNQLYFGYVLSGAGAQDGLYLPLSVNVPTVSDTVGPVVADHVLDASGAVANKLETPLFYATKWGSFEDLVDDDQPFDPAVDTWADASGQPKNYALVTEPSRLRVRLKTVLDNLLQQTASGTAAALSSGTLTGEGLVLQSLYHPVYTEQGGSDAITWVGTLNGMMLDRYGNFREDSNGNGALDATDTVAIVRSSTENGSQTTVFDRYPLDPVTHGPDLTSLTRELNLPLDELDTLWSARDRLADITNANIVDQRSNANSANTHRYIFTATATPVNDVYDGLVTATDVIDFTDDAVDVAANNLKGWLDVADDATAKNVINYVRGLDVVGYRSRTLKWSGSALDRVWRLGDIVHSTPAIVGRPSAGYDTQYSDDSYLEFRQYYANRRNMVYVGANDGMLHAFNAGFFDASSYTYSTVPRGQTPTASSPNLGAEMWAYVPHNTLPHLKWLTQPDYSHVYYVDSSVYTFDVNIFDPASTDHPGGWGTILVVGMRYGGGPYEVDVDADGDVDTTLRSSYVIMDVTNPEVAPQLIAEITDEDLGYAIAIPEVVKKRASNSFGGYGSNLGENEWHLVFGSGPQGANAITEGISDRPARLFSLNLNEVMAGTEDLEKVLVDDVTAFSYVGGIKAKDWNSDYKDDMLYFGVVGDGGRPIPAGGAVPPINKGALKQVDLNDAATGLFDAGSVSQLLTGAAGNLPFSVQPLAVRGNQDNYWVLTGTGRFLVKQDLDLTDNNKYFGVKVANTSYDPSDNTTGLPWLTDTGVAVADLYDVTDNKVYKNDLGGFFVESDDQGFEDLADYESRVSTTKPGWYRSLEGTSEANFTRSAFYEGSIAFNSYIPDVTSCLQFGVSPQYVLDLFTGLPQSRLLDAKLGSVGTVNGDEAQEVSATVGTVPGLLSEPVIANATAFSQNEKGETNAVNMTLTDGIPERRAWREIPLDSLLED